MRLVRGVCVLVALSFGASSRSHQQPPERANIFCAERRGTARCNTIEDRLLAYGIVDRLTELSLRCSSGDAETCTFGEEFEELRVDRIDRATNLCKALCSVTHARRSLRDCASLRSSAMS